MLTERNESGAPTREGEEGEGAEGRVGVSSLRGAEIGVSDKAV